jgi:hypothetical protein
MSDRHLISLSGNVLPNEVSNDPVHTGSVVMQVEPMAGIWLSICLKDTGLGKEGFCLLQNAGTVSATEYDIKLAGEYLKIVSV